MKLKRELVLIRSQFVQKIIDREEVVIWHSLFGNPKIVSKETSIFLDKFNISRKLKDVLDDKVNIDQENAIRELINTYYLITPGFDERMFLAAKMRERENDIVSGSLIDYLELIFLIL